MKTLQIETNDGEQRVMTPEEHQKMIVKYGKDKLPYTVITEPKRKIYGGPEPYGPDYVW